MENKIAYQLSWFDPATRHVYYDRHIFLSYENAEKKQKEIQSGKIHENALDVRIMSLIVNS